METSRSVEKGDWRSESQKGRYLSLRGDAGESAELERIEVNGGGERELGGGGGARGGLHISNGGVRDPDRAPPARAPGTQTPSPPIGEHRRRHSLRTTPHHCCQPPASLREALSR